MPVSEAVWRMQGEKGGGCLLQTLAKLTLANFLSSLPGPALPLTQGVFGEKPNLPEYKVAAIRKSPFILLHCGALRATWDGFILLATLYVAVTVPYSVCVSTAREPSAARGPPSVCDLAVEVLFILGKCALCLPRPPPRAGAPQALMDVCLASMPPPPRFLWPSPHLGPMALKSDLGSKYVSTTHGLLDPVTRLACLSLHQLGVTISTL